MNWDALGAVGEIAGAIAVVISLVYLAVQIRQSSNLAAAQAQREVMDNFQAQLDRFTNEIDLVRSALFNFESLSSSEKSKFHLIFVQQINHLEQPLRMRERGLETDDNVDMYGNICLVWLLTPGGKIIWETTRDYFFPLSRDYLEERLRNPDQLPPQIGEIAPWMNPE